MAANKASAPSMAVRLVLEAPSVAGTPMLTSHPDCGERVGQCVGGRCLLLSRDSLLDARNGIEHHCSVGAAVSLGVLGKKPPASRRLHKGFANGVEVGLAERRSAGGNRRQGKSFIGHGKLVA